MDDGRHDLAVSNAVASQLVGDQPPGRAALPLQELAQESFDRFLITATRDEDIEHIAILLYRAPEVLASTLYFYEDLVQVPRVVLPPLSVGEMTLRHYTALNYSQNSAHDLRRALNRA